MAANEGRHRRWVEDERRRLIEERCDRYELEWRALREPRIEDYLDGVEGEVRVALWLEIVMLDQELRGSNLDHPTPSDDPGSDPGKMILLDPSTADLAPIDEMLPERGERSGGLGPTRGARLLGDFRAPVRPARARDDTAEPLEPTEGMPGESTSPMGMPDTVEPLEGGQGVLAQLDGLAMARPGSTLGDYVLLEKLGQGGMGVVFKAWQKGLNRDVALKMIKAGMLADFRQVRLFQIEAEAVAALDHPHIVPILDSGEHQGILYYSMKLIDGRNLADGLDRFRDQPMAIARLLVRISEAIHHAHERGVLHRDLKPSNILVDERGEPHVIDFGLAKRLGEGVADESAATSHIMGTPSYMSPEQARGRRDEITTATDVYGLGTILYTLLSGRPPYTGPSTLEVLRRIHEQEVPAPHVHNPRVDRDLETICLKCLGKQPRDRYASARDLADDLNRWIEGRPIVARPASKVERAVKWVRRRPEIAALCALVVIVAVLGIAGIIWNWRAAITAREAAITASDEAITARDEAIRSEDYARHVAYAADLNLAERDWQDANIAQVRLRLDETRPPGGKSDLRGFEWYYLDALTRLEGRSLTGHSRFVNGVDYSRDGHHIASASDDRTIRLWDSDTGRAIRTMNADEYVKAIAFHPSGTRLASVGSARALKLWDVGTGQVIRSSAGHTSDIQGVAFSPDGKILASSSLDGTIKLWDGGDGSLVRTLSDHRADTPSGIAFSPDGKILASAGGGEPTIRLWDAAAGRIVRTVEEDLIDPGGSFAGQRRTYVEPTAQARRVLARRQAPGLGRGDGTIRLREAATGRPVLTLRDHRNLDAVTGLAFSADGRRLASISFNYQAVTLWDVATGYLLRTIKENSGTISDIAFAPDCVHLASACADRTVRIRDVTRDQEARSLPMNHVASDVAFSPDGSYLATALGDGTVPIHDRANGKVARTLRGHTAKVRSIAIGPDGRLAASSGDDRTVRIWEVATGVAIHVLKGHTDAVFSVAFAPDGRAVASAADDRTIKLWDVEAGKEIRTLSGHIEPVNAVAFGADGKTLASGGNDGFVMLWELSSGRRARAISHPGGLRAVASSPDGRRVAAGGYDPAIHVWDVATGRAVHTLKGHASGVTALAFSADSRRLVSSSTDRTVRIWDAVYGLEVLVLRGHSGSVWSVALSADGAPHRLRQR